MMVEDKEYILCAAVHYNDGADTYVHQPKNIVKGYVVCGHRHHNCITTNSMLTGVRNGENKFPIIQGFLTNTNRFVDRNEAMQIAKKSGQVPTSQSFEQLFSEDLY